MYIKREKKKKWLSELQKESNGAMGSPLFLVMANIYMEHFKEITLKIIPLTFILWFHQETGLCKLNKILRVEMEPDNKLAFLYEWWEIQIIYTDRVLNSTYHMS